MLDNSILKEQLYEFVRFESEPFDVDFLEKHANILIDRTRFYDILFELESEGKLIRLRDGRYIPTCIKMRKWIKERLVDVEIPFDLFNEVQKLISEFCLHETVEQFIVTALKKLIEEVRKCRS
ncbi:MAG: hypothetical protein QXN34_06995 [Archaeoglobaceae archaeon]